VPVGEHVTAKQIDLHALMAAALLIERPHY
jgi:hypothetical protein